MTERATHLVDHVLPQAPVRQWVLSLPFELRYRLAWDHALCRAVLAVYTRALQSFYRKQAKASGHRGSRTGTVTVIQRCGGALNLNVHFHTLAVDGACCATTPARTSMNRRRRRCTHSTLRPSINGSPWDDAQVQRCSASETRRRRSPLRRKVGDKPASVVSTSTRTPPSAPRTDPSSSAFVDISCGRHPAFECHPANPPPFPSSLRPSRARTRAGTP
jgi:hypothetical protein